MNQEAINNDLRWLMARMLEDFPGFIDEMEVNGGDLVQWFDYQLNCMPHLKCLKLVNNIPTYVEDKEECSSENLPTVICPN